MKSFYHIEGVQEGVRSLEESLEGIGLLGTVVKGATVLDLGCAEGLISQFCLKYGATEVRGLDANKSHIDTARTWAKGMDGLSFGLSDFNDIRTMPDPISGRWDVVLALSVIHKLRPECRVPFLARTVHLTKTWLFLRAPDRRIEVQAKPVDRALAINDPGKTVVGTLDLMACCETNHFQCAEQQVIEGKPWVGVFRRAS